MRTHNPKWNIWGRRITALLLLCGLLLLVMPQTDAASVTYKYNWIKSTTGLPTDNQWHDYFIAWEDHNDKNKVWFADYHWYTADGYNNYDAGGTHWMEYKAASTLPDRTSDSFSSKDCLGHMQIKYAGIDKDNGNSPKYYIRVSKMSGGYVYFTEYEPTEKGSNAEAFTFQDKGDVFHIFVNISGKADRYLTRDGQNLETTESSSYGGGEYWRPLRVYQRTFTIQETEQGDMKNAIGKVTLYEYQWINTQRELTSLPRQLNGAWADIVIAWEDAHGPKSNPDKVWYTKEVWTDFEDKPNYNNDGANEWWYYSNDYIGSDGYGSPYAETFILPYKASHFQMQFVEWDEDNLIYSDYMNRYIDSPKFYFRFEISQGKYIYIGNNAMYEDMDDAQAYTVQLRQGLETEGDIVEGDYNGSVWIFNNITWDQDEMFIRTDNHFTIENWNDTEYWQFPFRIYTYRPIEYDAIVKSFTIGKGATYSIESQLILNKGVTITVEDGGVLTIGDQLLNNGKIIVKNGGTVIVNEGACLMSFEQDAEGSIALDGGNLIIMDDARVICDQAGGVLEASKGSTIWNRGMLSVGKTLSLNHNSCLVNEANAMLLVGGNIIRERGGLGAFSFEEIASRVQAGKFTYLISSNSKIINKGIISEPAASYITFSEDAQANTKHVGNGHIDKRKP